MSAKKSKGKNEEREASGPQPKLPPVVLLALFSFFLILGAGPAYNSSALREYLRLGNYLREGQASEELALTSITAFQAMDMLGGAVIGFIYDAIGPRWTQAFLGQFLFAVGILLMRWERTLYVALVLQGIASVTMLTASLHLANLFKHRSKLALNILTAVVDLSAFLFPLMALAANRGFMGADCSMAAVCGTALAATLITVMVYPDEPFRPRSAEGKAALEALEEEQQQQQQHKDPEEEPLFQAAELEAGAEESSLRVSAAFHTRSSNLSVSVASVGCTETPLDLRGTWQAELLKPEWILVTLYCAFAAVRQNQYLDCAPEMLPVLGDSGGFLRRVLEWSVPMCCAAGIMNGFAMEAFGVVPVSIVLNLFGTVNSALSSMEGMPRYAQYISFACFVFNRASTLSTLFNFLAMCTALHLFAIMAGFSMVVAGVALLSVNPFINAWVIQSGVPTNWLVIQRWMTFAGVAANIPLLGMLYLQRKHLSGTDHERSEAVAVDNDN